jgi:hypothetical protein
MTVDWEERVNPERLRAYRLGRAREALDRSQLGALLALRLQQHPLRQRDPHRRVGARQDDPLRAAHAQRRAAPVGLRVGGQAPPAVQLPVAEPGERARRDDRPARRRRARGRPLHRAAQEIYDILREEGAADMPLGVDIVEPPMLAALRLRASGPRRPADDARRARGQSPDEIMLLNTACAMVDGVYQLIAEELKPGVRENELVAKVTKALFDMGSEHVDNINAVSGERCSPHPHVFSDRLIRPGDQAFFDIIQTFVGYKTCYYRTFAVGKATDAQRDAYKKAREWIDASIELMRPGVTTDQVASVWPKARSSASRARWSASDSSSATASASFLHERPIISRLNSLDHPVELKEGMVIALETYCPATDGYSAARIEEEVVSPPTARR